VDWVRLGVSKEAFAGQLMAPVADWAWDGGHAALDLRRFNFGPKSGSMVSFLIFLVHNANECKMVDWP